MDKNITKCITMFLTGAIIYFYFEILVRGYSHISMFLLGGVCFCIVGRLGIFILRISTSLVCRLLMIMIVASVVITSLELITGIIVNIYLNLSVWDYSLMEYNFMGQICLLYSFLWSLLGLPCVFFYGLIERFIIAEETENNTSKAELAQ